MQTLVLRNLIAWMDPASATGSHQEPHNLANCGGSSATVVVITSLYRYPQDTTLASRL